MTRWILSFISITLFFLSQVQSSVFAQVSQITAAYSHTCALLKDGTMKCWGDGTAGKLGNGSTGKQSIAVQVSGLNEVSQITAGGYYTCAFLNEGTVKCWGSNWAGQLGNGSTEDQSTPVRVSGLSEVSQITAGGAHACALLNDGTVKCWGRGSSGQLGNESTEHQNTPVEVSGLSQVSQISAGDNHTCTLLNDGTVECWGFGSNGELGNGSIVDQSSPVEVNGLSQALQITAGNFHTCALLNDGTVKCWGFGGNGQLGNGSTGKQSTAVEVSGLNEVSQIAAGGYHTCALLNDGTVKCWGRGDYGQLGNGSIGNQSSPVRVSSLSDVSQITAGYEHTCALLNDGTVKCWGNGDNGQLGNGSTENQNIPVLVRNLNLDNSQPDGFVRISAGTFTMGDIQGGGDSDESPAHAVTISQDFFIMDHEVTASEYKACVDGGGCNYNGSTSNYYRTYNVPGKENHPINDVSWAETQDYIAWKNQTDPGYGYRLCTEAEWEYVARAGTDTKWSCGNNESCVDDVAWHLDNAGVTKEVKTRQANAWGVYDMHGNIDEWVNDWYSESYYSTISSGVTDPTGPNSGSSRAIRGGNFFLGISFSRSANRVRGVVDRLLTAGFRLCSSIVEPSSTSTSSTTTTTTSTTTTTTSTTSSPPTTLPSIHSSTHTNPEYFYNGSSATFDLSQLNQSRTTGYYYYVDQNPTTVYHTTVEWLNASYSSIPLLTIDELSEGTHYLHAIAFGNEAIQGEAITFQFKVNSSAPDVSSTSHSDSTKAYSSKNAIVTWPPIDGMEYHYQMSENPFTIPTSSDSIANNGSKILNGLAGPPSGYDYISHFFHLMARDELGNISPAAHFQINICDQCGSEGIDITSGVQITSSTHPNSLLWYNNATPEFSFSGAQDGQYLYHFDTNPITLIQEASHTILSGNSLELPNEQVTTISKGKNYIHVRGYNGNFLETGVQHFKINIANQSNFRVSAPALLGGQSVNNLRLYWNHPLMSKTEQENSFPNYYVTWDQQADTMPEAQEANKVTTNSYLVSNITDGLYYLHIRSEDTVGGLSDTTHFAVSIGEGNDTSSVLSGLGQVIIVAGGGAKSTNTLWPATNALTLQAYRTFKARGFSDNDIYLYHPDQGIDIDGNGSFETISDDTTPTVAEFQAQIKAFRDSDETGPLYIYLVDHGAIDKFQILPYDILKADEFDSMLDNFQSLTNRQVVVVIEACHSGSFIDDLEDENRIVLTSTDDQLAFLNQSGSLSYSAFLLQGVFRGLSMTAAHENSKALLSELGRPYTNMRPQVTPSTIDPVVGGDVFIADFVPEISSYLPSGNVNHAANTALGLQIAFSDHDEKMKVWAVITPPDFTPPTTSSADFATPQVFLPKVDLTLTDSASHTYQGSYQNLSFRGTYLVQFFAQMPNGEVLVSNTASVNVDDGEGVTPSNNYTANLQRGWTLIGTNNLIEGETVAIQLADLLDDGLESVWGWNAASRNWRVWFAEQSLNQFNEHYGTTFDELTKLEPGIGYWIRLKNATYHTLNGTPATTSPALVKGWNLVVLGAGSIEAILTQLPSTTHSIWSWNGEAWKVYSPNTETHQIGEFDILTEVEEGQGYWVRVQ